MCRIANIYQMKRHKNQQLNQPMIAPELEAWQGVELFWNTVPRTET